MHLSVPKLYVDYASGLKLSALHILTNCSWVQPSRPTVLKKKECCLPEQSRVQVDTSRRAASVVGTHEQHSLRRPLPALRYAVARVAYAAGRQTSTWRQQLVLLTGCRSKSRRKSGTELRIHAALTNTAFAFLGLTGEKVQQNPEHTLKCARGTYCTAICHPPHLVLGFDKGY